MNKKLPKTSIKSSIKKFLAKKIHNQNKINPNHPTGLEPSPKTVDTVPLLHEQFRKPLNPENRRERHDMMHA